MLPMQITVKGMPYSAALDLLIRQKLSDIERFCATLMGCRVFIEKSHQHKKPGELFDVAVEVHISGQPHIVIKRQHVEDVHVAVRDAFDDALRKVLEYVQIERSQRNR